MNLISCDNCGVVLDKSKLNFPTIIEDDNGYIDEKCIWTGNGYVPMVLCPVCKEPIGF